MRLRDGSTSWHDGLPQHVLLAEAGSVQLEWRQLARLTGQRRFAALAERAAATLRRMERRSAVRGLLPHVLPHVATISATMDSRRQVAAQLEAWKAGLRAAQRARYAL